MSRCHHPSTWSTGSRPLPVVSRSHYTKEVLILKKGAEGKLLVPDVKMKRVGCMSAMSSCSSSYIGMHASESAYDGGRLRSMLNLQGSELSIDDTGRSQVKPRLSSGQLVLRLPFHDCS